MTDQQVNKLIEILNKINLNLEIMAYTQKQAMQLKKTAKQYGYIPEVGPKIGSAGDYNQIEESTK
jgi:hypothetical protein